MFVLQSELTMLTEEKVESWLDKHPDFVHDYFMRKASREMVNLWLLSHSSPQRMVAENSSSLSEPRSHNSGATSIVRKMSIREFEKGGLFRCLTSQQFDVSCSSVMEQLQQKKGRRIPLGPGIVGYIDEIKGSLSIPGCYQKNIVPSTRIYRLLDLKFNDFMLDDEDMLKACVKMFNDLGLIERFRINPDVLCRWLLSVRKNCSQVAYHNWRHAFNVAQIMFSFLKITKLWQVFGKVETLSLLIACLCHDLEYKGTNNSFQIKSYSPLAQLYSTSTEDHPHFIECIKILNSEGNRILSHLTPDEYSTVLHVLEDAFSAADLAVHVRTMLMKLCDVAVITKPCEIQLIAFQKIFGKLQPLLDGVRKSKELWLKLAEARNLCMSHDK